jgi:hypothetical protein
LEFFCQAVAILINSVKRSRFEQFEQLQFEQLTPFSLQKLCCICNRIAFVFSDSIADALKLTKAASLSSGMKNK